MISGERVDLLSFRAGWLKMSGNKAHYFQRLEGRFEAECGGGGRPVLRDSDGLVAFRPGTYDLCRRCEAALMKRAPNYVRTA